MPVLRKLLTIHSIVSHNYFCGQRSAEQKWVTGELQVVNQNQLLLNGSIRVPSIIHEAGEHASKRFIEFFAATIRNPNTRDAYYRACTRFLNWCDGHGFTLASIEPLTVAAYIEQLSRDRAAPTVKLHLAALRMVFDWLVIGAVVPTNPCLSVKGPRHVVTKGKTPVLSGQEARQLLDSIPVASVDPITEAIVPIVVGLRDRALIAVMVYSLARISAVVNMDVGDYFANGKRFWMRLHEKGGRHHEVPCHHNVEWYVDAYLDAAGIGSQRRAPLFRAAPGVNDVLSDRRMSRKDSLAMVKRRCRDAGLNSRIGNHSFRATGITTYLQNGGTLEHAQRLAAHSSATTTKLYDRTHDELTLDEIERIVI